MSTLAAVAVGLLVLGVLPRILRLLVLVALALALAGWLKAGDPLYGFEVIWQAVFSR